jgi:hypothetical protein
MIFSRLKDKFRDLSPLKDTALLIGILAGIFLIGGLLWFFTGSARDRFLQDAVNRVMAGMDEPLRLNGVSDRMSLKRIPLGKWYNIDGSGDLILVFPLISGGAALPCGAVVNPGGKVDRVIPLGIHGAQLFRNLPQGILRIYIHRIETELARWGEEKQ